MTREEAVIISAYTGVAMCSFGHIHEYIEKVLGRPVWTHELADPSVCEQIKDASRSDFVELCKRIGE